MERVKTCYKLADRVICDLSGGKDSGSCVEVALIAARELGRPLIVRYFDEELMMPDLEAYLMRMRERSLADGDWEFRWYAFERAERLGWDGREWRIFDSRCPGAWIRQPPAFAVREIPGGRPGVLRGWERFESDEARAHMPASTCVIGGRRIAENPTRAMLTKTRGWYLSPYGKLPYARACPIFDWSNQEVWQAIRARGWDWNRHYLKLWRAGVGRNYLRHGLGTGLQGTKTMHLMRRIAPEVYARAVVRLPAIELCERYGESALMGAGAMHPDAPPVTAESILAALRRLGDGEIRKSTKTSLRNYVRKCLTQRMPIDPRQVYRIAARGDGDVRRLSGRLGFDLRTKALAAGHYQAKNAGATVNRVKAAVGVQRREGG